ncbi:hypothetical protein CFC35_10450 [Streptomyces sp. FBKL.4005]|uniref:hypothetical protein n=1 Tax=Streptomyces sp. FBKL.4005 TaxID=2015515 RepID=UPI000B9657FA|nr:hypothetical protein [Streptomyces sp. FBKL.4005]OYP14872.1 hypothetical protein CFC35_10450 [Streptomyces sp. FBKL.4005]
MADAQITLAYSRNTGVVAIATGEQYKSAEGALNDAGFRRGEARVYRVAHADEAAARGALAYLAQRAEARGIQVKASSRRFIGDAAQDIARCLPGQWDTQVEIYSHPVWQEDLVPYLWDSGELARVVRTHRIPYAATLTDPVSGTTLLLIEHLGHQLGYLVGAFAPEPFGEGFDDPYAPRSVTLPPFPGRAAQVITQRYLPAYDRAVHERRISHVAEALDLIQSEWDSWKQLRIATEPGGALGVEPPVFTTAAGGFLDNAWREFLTVLDHAPALLDQCRGATSLWPQDAEVLDQLAAALLTAQQVREDLSRGVPLARAEHHAQTGPAIETWLVHSRRFLRQARAASPRPRPTAVLPQPPRRLPPGQARHR